MSDSLSLIEGSTGEVRAFYAQLSEREMIAHTIAVEKLGTSYDVTRTHGFLKWRKTVAAHTPAVKQ
jgi:hypothetical protein